MHFIFSRQGNCWRPLLFRISYSMTALEINHSQRVLEWDKWSYIKRWNKSSEEHNNSTAHFHSNLTNQTHWKYRQKSNQYEFRNPVPFQSFNNQTLEMNGLKIQFIKCSESNWRYSTKYMTNWKQPNIFFWTGKF